MQAQANQAAVTFRPYAEKSKAKRALSRSYGIADVATSNFLCEQGGKWGFMLKDGEPYAEQIAAALDAGMAQAEAEAAPVPNYDTHAKIADFIETATDEHDDTPTTSNAFAMMVNPPVAPVAAPSTVVRDGKVIDPSTAADDKADQSVNPGEDACPLCNGHPSSQTWANEGVSCFCHSCGKTYSVSTGREIRTGFKRDNVNKGYKIEKDRPAQNGMTHPSAGTLCGQIWDILSAKLAAGQMPVASDLDSIAAAGGFDRTTVSCQFYAWRKFNGIKGRQVKSK